MKKVLLTVAALGLALAYTATTASAMTFTMGGKVNLTGIYLNHGDSSSAGFKAGLVDDGTDDNVDGWHYSVYTYPKLVINDNTSVQGELRFIDREPFGADPGSDRDTMKVFKLWANWVAPFGTVSFGRLPAGTWGGKYLDSTGSADRIKIATSLGATGIYGIYQKREEDDAFWGGKDEGDAASYIGGVSIGSDMGKTDVAVMWSKYDEQRSWGGDEFTNTEFWFNGVYSLGAIGIAAEAKYVMGEDSSLDDISSFAAMVNVSTKLDTTTVGFLGFYGQGDDDSDGDNNGYTTKGGFGNDFNPFVIATGDYFGILNGDKNPYLSAVDWGSVTGNGDNPGAIAAALYAVMPVNDQMTINAAVGHIWADKDFGYDNKMGLEVDFGMSYKLVSNLTWSASVAYMKTGQMIEDAFGDTNNILALVQSLTMTW